MTSVESWLLAFCRFAPVVVLHPVFGGKSVPRVVAVGTAAALALATTAAGRGASRPTWLVVGMATELVAGVVVGLVGQAVFGAIEAAGRFVDDARGANVARLYAPQIESAASPVGQLELVASLAVFWGLGLHAPLVASLAGPDAPRLSALSLDATLDLATRLSRAGLALAGPAAASCVIVDLAMGLVNRAAPAANVFLLGQPVKLTAAVLVTALGMPARVTAWGGLWGLQSEWTGRIFGGS